MILQKVTYGYFYIADPDAVRIIKQNNIDKIYYEYNTDYDKRLTITAYSDAKKNKNSSIIENIDGHIRTRHPKCLRGFIGCNINIYYDYLSTDKTELFKIKIMNGLTDKDFPYFTTTLLVLPSIYINDHLDCNAISLRASLNNNNEYHLEKGMLFLQLKIIKENEIWNYPLYQSHRGLTTRTMIKFIDWIFGFNKRIEDFKYSKTVQKPGDNKYGTIVFQEKL